MVRGLAAHVPAQRLIVRQGRPLAARLGDVPNLTLVPVAGRLGAARAAAGASLVHAHETGGAQAAFIRNRLSGVPYLITRRVDNVPKPDFFTRAMYRRAAAIAVLSGAIESSLADYDSSLRTYKIPSAASSSASDAAWVRAYRERFAGKFLVGHVAALDIAHKGQLALVGAAAEIERSHPEVHFVVVGSGRDEARILEAARGFSNMTFAGWADNVSDYLAAFDVFTLPSKREGLGSILIDAMQAGLPVVATRVGGIPDLITHGRNGLLVPEDDSAALAGAIVRLLSDPALRAAMAEANRLRARDFQPEVMTERYLRLYRELAPELAARASL
ncbi:MAG TPA: glycosyltransferase family 4 protein [Gammaproteobacteria bacterium]|nr:glycosyltransferase family 4 protein [Gammaproteobacteria bacterium]